YFGGGGGVDGVGDEGKGNEKAVNEGVNDGEDTEEDEDVVMEDAGLTAETDPVRYYLNCLTRRGSLMTSYEALLLARTAIEDRSYNKFWECAIYRKFECTEELGDLFRPIDVTFALSIYTRANVLDKMIECLLSSGQYTQVIRLVRATNQYDFASIVRQVKETRGDSAAVRFSVILLREDPQQRPAVVQALGLERETERVDRIVDWLVAWDAGGSEGGSASGSDQSWEDVD
ncbi:hypothetical protein HK104_007531, partial [Borealophlyctis nickersoniae]